MENGWQDRKAEGERGKEELRDEAYGQREGGRRGGGGENKRHRKEAITRKVM